MNEGLKVKYNVTKVCDGSVVNDCFVLRPDKDPVAVAALRAYAATTENKALAADIVRWIGEEPNEPLTPEQLLVLEPGEIIYCTPLNDWAKVTHWGILFFGTEDYRSWPEIKNDYGKTWLAYRRKPESEC